MSYSNYNEELWIPGDNLSCAIKYNVAVVIEHFIFWARYVSARYFLSNIDYHIDFIIPRST